jgi:cytidine deaminase
VDAATSSVDAGETLVAKRAADPAWWSHVHGLPLVTQGAFLEERMMMYGLLDEPILVELACRAADLAYAPYSKFKVGAVVYCFDGEKSHTFSGANIENSSYGLTICAERVAIFNTVLAGMQGHARTLMLATSTSIPASPCGACLQVAAEFFDQGLRIISVATRGKEIKRWTLRQLLPEAQSVFKL